MFSVDFATMLKPETRLIPAPTVRSRSYSAIMASHVACLAEQ